MDLGTYQKGEICLAQSLALLVSFPSPGLNVEDDRVLEVVLGPMEVLEGCWVL